jgi:hypothetical protein
MGWLDPTEDEVGRFHPAFQAAGTEALNRLGIQNDYEWVHHLRPPGTNIIPDFVLVHRATRRWLAALELKRRRESVYSTRFQIQAKGYAEANQQLYRPTAARYFALSNLEITLLFALNGDRPTRECRVDNGLFESGRFDQDTADAHRERFTADIQTLITSVIQNQQATFESVWPAILADFLQFADALPATQEIVVDQPNTPNWALVQDYFGTALPLDSSRVFLLRCLMAEYIRGILLRYRHPLAAQIPPVREDQGALARTIASLRDIDFRVLFEQNSPELYRALQDRASRELLVAYTRRIIDPASRVADLAQTRVDYPQLIDDLLSTLMPVEIQDESGRVQTDPELAEILAHLTINQRGEVIDPCCGDGILLSAAYDRLRSLGGSNEEALMSVSGIEADSISGRLASVRLGLKEPAAISPALRISLVRADMFASRELLARSNFVLMNPPFKRYEAQDRRPVPRALRDHYNTAIAAMAGPTTTRGQVNLFNFYVEFVTRAVQPGTIVGFILDNRWYHNGYGKALRQLFLDNYRILGLVEYPHSSFFSNWSIATSLIIAERSQDRPAPGAHQVKFVRSKSDPRAADLVALSNAFQGDGAWPADWSNRSVDQRQLNADMSWKDNFATELNSDYRLPAWPTLDTLFASSRRGSLEKEGGGIGVLEFPFDRTDYGPKRRALPDPHAPFQTGVDRDLTDAENRSIRQAATAIPLTYRGWALQNSDNTTAYVLTEQDVSRNQTLEPPILREHPELFTGNRSQWTDYHNQAVAQLQNDASTAPFVHRISNLVNLNETVLPRHQLWNVLREPFAGELIIPRKMRTGHRVYLNAFAFTPGNRQVRLSSNFVTYRNCTAIDAETGLDRPLAAELIVAFLVSSFGQLQFELEGANREGCLAVEKEQLSRVKIFDPRWIRPNSRNLIIAAFRRIPYPVSTERLSNEQPERNELDGLIAAEIVIRFPEFNVDQLLSDTHSALDEWLGSREP